MSCADDDVPDNTIRPPVVVGSSREFDVFVAVSATDPTGYVLTGAKGFMTAKRRLEDETWVIRKRTLNAGGGNDQFVLLDQSVYPGRARFYLVPEDTAGLDPKLTLKYDVWFELPDGRRKTVVAHADMPLDWAVTTNFG